jgi:hypothetical protein
MKLSVLSLMAAGLLCIGTPVTVEAAKFNSSVANPFKFCSLPKPCKHCHPWRTIYNEICADQANAGKGEQSAPVANTPILETMDQDGKKWYLRTVDGYTLRTARRVDLEDASLNSDRPVDGLEVINGPSDAQLVRQ